jgi:hypothetical protein
MKSCTRYAQDQVSQPTPQFGNIARNADGRPLGCDNVAPVGERGEDSMNAWKWGIRALAPAVSAYAGIGVGQMKVALSPSVEMRPTFVIEDDANGNCWSTPTSIVDDSDSISAIGLRGHPTPLLY